MNENIYKVEIYKDNCLFEQYVTSRIHKGDGLCFDFKEYDEELINKIINLINELKSYNHHYPVYIKATRHHFNNESINCLYELQKKLDTPLKLIGGLKDDYSLEDYLYMKEEMNKIIVDIKKLELSPLEELIYIYRYVTEFDYLEDDTYLSRDLMTTIKTKKMVCTGYVNFIIYLCEELDILAINQLVFSVNTIKNIEIPHENLLVFLDDHKYKTRGLYYLDPTWDRVTENYNIYSFFLLNLDNLDHIKNTLIKPCGDASILYSDEDYFYKITSNPFNHYMFGYNDGFDGENYTKLILKFELRDLFFYRQALTKEEFVNDRSMFNKALDRVKELFKEYQVDDDIYEKKFNVPYGTTLDYLVALEYQELEDLVIKQIKKLKELDVNEGDHFYCTSVGNYNYEKYDEDYLQGLAQSISEMTTKIWMYGLIKNASVKDRLIKGKTIKEETLFCALKEVYEKTNTLDKLKTDIDETKRYSKIAFTELENITLK